MAWFNYYGLTAIIIIIIPNILASFLDKSVYIKKFENKPLQIAEQTGRYGCMAFMVFNIPYTYFGFWFAHGLIVYLAVGGALLLAYLIGWLVFGKGKKLIKMLYLSVIPTVLFASCGIMVSSVPLIVCAALFGAAHITISCKNSEA